MTASQYNTFAEVRARLDEIVTQVRKKDLSLEASLDLYEEAIQHCNRAAELVDKPDFSAEELEKAQDQETGDEASAAPAADDEAEAPSSEDEPADAAE